MGSGMDWDRAREREQDPDAHPHYDDGRSRGSPTFAALLRIKFRCQDVAAKLALELAQAGESVVYASDWDPGSRNLEALATAGVECHTALRRKT